MKNLEIVSTFKINNTIFVYFFFPFSLELDICVDMGILLF